jgi:hypothetical protein
MESIRLKGPVVSKKDRFKNKLAKWNEKHPQIHEDYIFEQIKAEKGDDYKPDMQDIRIVMYNHFMGCCTCKKTKDCTFVEAHHRQQIAVEKALSKHRMSKHEEPDISKLSIKEAKEA